MDSRTTNPGSDHISFHFDSSYKSVLSSVLSSPDSTSQKVSSDIELNDLNAQKKSIYTEEQILLALKSAQQAQPRTFNIVNHNKSRLNICALGCQGSDKDAPKRVAELLNQIVSKYPDLKPDLFIILGDNFYPDGVFGPADPRFESQFHQTYGNKDLENICGVPCIVVLGNHDGGRDTETHLKSWVPFHNTLLGTNPLNNADAERQQIAHSYLQHPSDPEQKESKQEFFQRNNLDYTLLPKHLMPHFFNSWIIDTVEVFALNSNTYVKDYLALLRQYAFDQPVDPNNQAAWTQRKYFEAVKAGRSAIFAMHHPLFTAGKRAYPLGWDAKHYLAPEEITLVNQILQLSPDAYDFKEKLRAIFNEKPDSSRKLESNGNYNEMLTRIMCDFQKMSPDMVTTAHDHSIYYFNNRNEESPHPKICQVVSGGGGSQELQPQLFFGMQNNLGCFLREYGVSIFSCDKKSPKLFEINLFSTPLSRDETDKRLSGLTPHVTHLQFTSKSPQPYRKEENDERVKKIRDIVLHACRKYQEFLHKKQTERKDQGKFFDIIPNVTSLSGFFKYNTKHTLADVDRMNEMIAFLNEPEPSSFKDTVIFLQNRLGHLSNKDSNNSLYLEINEVLQAEFNGNNIDQLSELVRAPEFH